MSPTQAETFEQAIKAEPARAPEPAAHVNPFHFSEFERALLLELQYLRMDVRALTRLYEQREADESARGAP